MFESFFIVLLSGFALTVLVHAQDQSGYISIDCGASSDYIDPKTNITYTRDAGFINTGLPKSVSPNYNDNIYPPLLWNVRTFPNGTRNCYSVKLETGNQYLIRATFMYGNYDGKSEAPKFDMHLGTNFWDSIDLVNESTIITKEIMHHIPSSNPFYLCLVNTGHGTPLISGLEFRNLKNTAFDTRSGSLETVLHGDVATRTNETVRFKDDVCDRLWTPLHFDNSKELNTNQMIDSTVNNFPPPGIVMQTAATPENSNDPLNYIVTVNDNSSDNHHVYMHFAELVALESYQSRSFNIFLNGNFWYGPVIPKYLSTTSVHKLLSPNTTYNFSFYQTETSTLPPLINAIEFYAQKRLFEHETAHQDVAAVLNIKSEHKLLSKDWQGDPCSPKNYTWDGLNCSYNDSKHPRIISLNLSSTGLTGEVPCNISNLDVLQVLDLSYNNLIGSVPDFLADLTSLKVLNLNGNNLTGFVPEKLLERSRDGSLYLSIDQTNNCTSNSCVKKKSVLVPVVVSVASIFVLIIAGVGIFLMFKRREKQARKMLERKQNEPNPTFESKNSSRRFTYAEILTITNNLETVIGEGGFGKVYLGNLDNEQVAAKVLSVSSRQGYSQFQAEINLLTRVHHRHLTTLVGYCEEENKIGLIYEYMANKDLSKHLSESSTSILSWEERLKIAVEAAQGLEYLHDGCKPPIVHRDVKTTNILLNHKFQAKLSDFGVSKSFPIEGATHIYTNVAGTPGYLEPEYYVTGRLTEKSDVYSFGVVLLEIITCRPVISFSTEENKHIIQWVNNMLSSGNIKGIVDKRLFGDFDINSAWRALEIAMDCVSVSPTRRPTINHAVIELKECLNMEISRRKEINGTAEILEESFDMFTVVVQTEMIPLAR